MTTAVQTPFERWLDSVCRHFSQATGWPLAFAPRGSLRAQAFESSAFHGESVWVGPIDDEAERLGFLYVELPADQRVDRSFLGVCDLAALVAELVSGQCAAARKLESRSLQFATLVDVGISLPTDDDVPSALRRLLGAALKLTGFRSVGFFLLEPTTQELRLRLEEHLEPRLVPRPVRLLESSPADVEALTNGLAIIRRSASAAAADWLPDDVLTACCLRVPSKAGPMGTLWVYDRRTRAPTDREVHVLQSVAVQAAAALERIVLLKESADQQRLQAELRLASENQNVEHEPLRDPRIEAVGYCRSNREVGGDLCEIIPLDEWRTLIAVGDAAGDSIPASLVMSAVRGALRTLVFGPLPQVLATDVLMARINQALHSITPTHLFMSMVAGVVDTLESTFTYTNAGHPTPLVLQEGAATPTTSHGLLLGVAPDTAYEKSVVPLAPGDLIVLYSDGISEARDSARRMFRSDGILDAVRKHPGQSADGVLNGILAEFATHTGGRAEGDDRSLLVVRVRE